MAKDFSSVAQLSLSENPVTANQSEKDFHHNLRVSDVVPSYLYELFLVFVIDLSKCIKTVAYGIGMVLDGWV